MAAVLWEALCHLVGACAVCALAYILILFKRWRFSELNELPGPARELTVKRFLLGNTPELSQEAFFAPHIRWWRESRDGPRTKMLHYTGTLGRHMVCVLDADGVKHVLTSKAAIDRPLFEKGMPYLRRVLGNGLVPLDGKRWYRHRRIIQPSFNNQLVKSAIQSEVPNLVDRLICSWKKRPGEIELSSHMSCLTLDIIGKVAFNHDFTSMDLVEQWSRGENDQVDLGNILIAGIYHLLMPNFWRLAWAWFGVLMPLERFIQPKSYKTMCILNGEVDSVVRRARAVQKQGTRKGTKCLLDLLFEATDERDPQSRTSKLSNQELRDETKTFLVAGHETTSTLIVWTIYCLILHPDSEKKVFEDVTRYAQGSTQITIEQCDKMEYLSAFVKEVMRLYPPVGMVVRSNSRKCNLLGSTIPKGTRIVIPVYLLHRHPLYWTDPDVFKPERWLKSGNGSQVCSHHFAFLPFSCGPRNCIGQRFAMYEAMLVLAPLIREFTFSLAPSMEGEIKLKNFITLKSDPALKVLAHERKSFVVDAIK